MLLLLLMFHYSLTFVLQFVLLRFWVTDEEDPDDVTEELEVACRKWIKMNDANEFECLWPATKLNPTQLRNPLTKQEEPGEGWKPHKCEIVSCYGKLSAFQCV